MVFGRYMGASLVNWGLSSSCRNRYVKKKKGSFLAIMTDLSPIVFFIFNFSVLPFTLNGVTTSKEHQVVF
jgi:hypothetical protein